MQHKTRVHAEDGKHDILISREFGLPLNALFRAYSEPEIISQWMGTTVLKHENKKHGAWQFQTTDIQGNVVFQASGVIHEFVPNEKITRTFEIETAALGVQLEFLEFESISDRASKLTIHIVFRSVAHRDQMLRLPFAQGLNMAHNRLQNIVSKLS